MAVNLADESVDLRAVQTADLTAVHLVEWLAAGKADMRAACWVVQKAAPTAALKAERTAALRGLPWVAKWGWSAEKTAGPKVDAMVEMKAVPRVALKVALLAV